MEQKPTLIVSLLSFLTTITGTGGALLVNTHALENKLNERLVLAVEKMQKENRELFVTKDSAFHIESDLKELKIDVKEIGRGLQILLGKYEGKRGG